MVQNLRRLKILAYSWIGYIAIADWAYVGIFAVAVQFENQDKFWIPNQKLHVACILDFSKKNQNELVCPFLVFFLAILVPELIVV